MASFICLQDATSRDTGVYDTSTWVIDNSSFVSYIKSIGDEKKLESDPNRAALKGIREAKKKRELEKLKGGTTKIFYVYLVSHCE